MPQGLSMEFLGAAGAYEKSLSSQLWLILAAMVCVYIVLGVLYESYIHPVTILSTLPSAGVGAILGLMLFKQEFTIIAFIGVLLLCGIVLALPGLSGFMDYNFMPYIHVLLAILYWTAGY